MNILPQKKIEKFSRFCRKIAKFLQFKFTRSNRRTFFFVPWGPEYCINLKMHTKSRPGAYQKEEWLKTSILYQNKSTKTCKEMHQNLITQDIHKKWNCYNTRTPKPSIDFFTEPRSPVWKFFVKIVDGEGQRGLSIAS